MKSALRIARKLLPYLPALLLVLVTVAAFGQTPSAPATPTPAQTSFNNLKALSGTWSATLDGKPVTVTLRTASMGNALLHEMHVANRPEDPITIVHLDADHLVLTHYCDSGNQPHMVATISPDGKIVSFDFLRATNLLPTQAGHMRNVVFTILSPNHHLEIWQFQSADGAQIDSVLDLTRTP